MLQTNVTHVELLPTPVTVNERFSAGIGRPASGHVTPKEAQNRSDKLPHGFTLRLRSILSTTSLARRISPSVM